MLKTFKVTKDTLQESVKKIKEGGYQTSDCVIATILKSVFTNKDMKFNGTTLTTDGTYKRHTVMVLPQEVNNYAFKFDISSNTERLQMPEFEFTLDIPNHLLSPTT